MAQAAQDDAAVDEAAVVGAIHRGGSRPYYFEA